MEPPTPGPPGSSYHWSTTNLLNCSAVVHGVTRSTPLSVVLLSGGADPQVFQLVIAVYPKKSNHG